MINNIYIFNESKEVSKERSNLGIVGENKYEALKFTFEEFVDGIGTLEIQREKSEKAYIILEKEEDC